MNSTERILIDHFRPPLVLWTRLLETKHAFFKALDLNIKNIKLADNWTPKADISTVSNSQDTAECLCSVVALKPVHKNTTCNLCMISTEHADILKTIFATFRSNLTFCPEMIRTYSVPVTDIGFHLCFITSSLLHFAKLIGHFFRVFCYLFLTCIWHWSLFQPSPPVYPK